MADVIINPLESRLMATQGIRPLQNRHEYGELQKTGQQMANSMLKIYEETKVNLKNSYLADYRKKVQEFESKLQYDDSYYKDPSKMAGLKEELSMMKDEFKKMGEDVEFFQEDYDEIANIEDSLDLRVETAYQTKYTNWRETEIKEDYLAGQLQNAQNNRTTMMLGHREDAVNDFNSNLKSYERGIKNDYLTEEEAIKTSLGERIDLITGNVMSYTNKENALAIYNQMANMTFEEFREHYKDTIYKLNGKTYDLTDMEYEAFKRSISSGMAEVNRKVKAQEELSKAKEEAHRQEVMKKPAEWATKTLNMKWGDPYAPVLNEFMTLAANNKYGADFESAYDVIKYNLPPVGLEAGFNLPVELYNDVNSSGEIIMNEWSKKWDEGCSGRDETLQRAYMDSGLGQGVHPAINYQTGKTYFYGKGYFRTLYNEIYQQPYNELAQAFEKQNINISNTLYDVNRTIAAVPNKAGQEMLRIKKTVNLTMFGELQGLRQAGQYDERVRAMSEGIDKISSQTLIKIIFDETGGVVTEDIADELDLKDDTIGMSLANLSPTKKQEMLNYMTTNEKVIEKFNKMFEPAFREYTEGYKAIDLGNGNLGYIKSRRSVGDLENQLQDIVKNGNLKTSVGDIPPAKKIKIRTYTEENKVVFTYRNEITGKDEILEKDGEPYVLELDKK